ncbi:hypothetical protein D3C86_1624110 [compost metagenome]
MGQTLASVIEVLADLYLKTKTSGAAKEEPKQNLLVTPQKLGGGFEPSTTTSTKGARVNKTITPLTRRLILQRDKCCQYRDPKTEKICGSLRNPQVDHKTSRWAGGTNEYENLQQLCANHNRLKYRNEAQLRLE